uniref:Protein HGH1 homolog n=1 Tax=Hemiselmis andersenii TaxID=464988 RepID=A0A6U4T974_HEMAN|mmetsp:Transcript_16514/g.39756  ORF Transcript_16514/g.39756 Transcript_16514/m.39756 type:complete len:241 (+) Transcript_16514:972-1694(+)
MDPEAAGGFMGDADRVMRAECAMVVARLTGEEDLPALQVSDEVLSTIVHCLKCSIEGRQFVSFSWRPMELLRPIRQMSHSERSCRVLAGEGACELLLGVLQMPSSTENTPPPGHAPAAGLGDCVEALVNLAAHPAGIARLRAARLPPHGAGGRPVTAAEVLEAAGRRGVDGRVGSGLWVLRERHTAVMMALHPRLGAGSWLGHIEEHLLGAILEESCTAGVAATGLAAFLTQSAGGPVAA